MRWVILTLLMPATLWAHEVQYEVEPNRATAVKVHFSDGESLSYAEFEIYAPRDPAIPFQKGRTDRDGYLSFVPNADGTWRIKVIDESGHGLDVGVEVSHATAIAAGCRSNLRTWLKPVVGLLLIAVIFFGLYRVARKRKKK